MSQLNWLYLDLNSFFASVEQQLRPELRGKPVAVVPAQTDATCAIAASYEAKAFGIKTGTKIYDAKRMCPGLICISANHEHYVHYHHRILSEINRHIPVTRVESIDEVSCKLDDRYRDEEAALALGQRIKDSIRHRLGSHIKSSVGLGPNRFLAKTASNLKKPDGLSVLYAEDVPGKILHWEPSDLVGVGHGMDVRLKRAGIFTMEQLYALSPKHMRTLWGSVQGERYYHMLRGVELDELATKRSTVSHSHVLEPHYRPVEQSWNVMRRLVLKAASRMRRLGYYATQMSMSLRIEHGPRIAHTVHFYRCCDNRALQHEAMELWQLLINAYEPERLKKVSVTLHGLVAADDIQPELFDVLNQGAIQFSKRQEQLSRAVDDLNARFGRDTVVTGQLPRQVRCFSGTKVAFTRIPQREEFYE